LIENQCIQEEDYIYLEIDAFTFFEKETPHTLLLQDLRERKSNISMRTNSKKRLFTNFHHLHQDVFVTL